MIFHEKVDGIIVTGLRTVIFSVDFNPILKVRYRTSQNIGVGRGGCCGRGGVGGARGAVTPN